MQAPTIDRAAISAAMKLIAGHVRRTPVMEIAGFGPEPLHLKLECLQHAGSFKPRGAFLNLLTREVPAAGVAAASGGNHGAAVAYAARSLGHRARIFVPEVAPEAKRALIRRLGAEIVVGGPLYPDALAACEAYQAESGAISVHAYDAPETLTGQGTVGLEFEEQVPGLDTVLVAVGGGGLIGGIAAWFAGGVKVVAVEPEGCPAFHAARTAGEPVDAPAGGAAVDSLGARRIGTLAFGIGQSFVAEAVLVSDAAILDARRRCWDEINLAVEPGGATALAALTSGAYRPAQGERVGVVMCGANTDLSDFQ